MNIQDLKQVSFEAGRLTGKAFDKASEFAREKQLAEKVEAAREKAIQKYEQETGRNASLGKN